MYEATVITMLYILNSPYPPKCEWDGFEQWSYYTSKAWQTNLKYIAPYKQSCKAGIRLPKRRSVWTRSSNQISSFKCLKSDGKQRILKPFQRTECLIHRHWGAEGHLAYDEGTLQHVAWPQEEKVTLQHRLSGSSQSQMLKSYPYISECDLIWK